MRLYMNVISENLSHEKKDSHLNLVEDYFNKHSRYWSDVYFHPKNIHDFILINRNNIAVKFLCSYLSPGNTILDAGCGAGVTMLSLIVKGFFVHGIDISPKMLDLCQQNLSHHGIDPGHYQLTQTDLYKANLPRQSFDGIVALGFLQYQPDEFTALKALQSLLKPGGILVLSGPTKIKLTEYFGLAKLYYSIKNRRARFKNNSDIAVLHKISSHYYSVRRFKRLLKRTNFEMLDFKGHGFVNFAIIKDWTSRGQYFLHRFFTGVSKFLPIQRFANDLVVVARKSGEE
ncbi:MAG: class I SAM-dependent methyltransferase [Calditrichaeota bacterium]|nr:MAG: class I SAM-dependent methyltransferase [Calditrichota bacterium]